MRAAIVGSRSVTMKSYPILEQNMPEGVTEIVSGHSKGADQLAEEYARRHQLPLRTFLPEYEKYRRNAPLQRNISIAQYSDFVLVLWDGKSRGSAHMIQACIQEYTPVHILLIRDDKLVQTLYGQEKTTASSEELSDMLFLSSLNMDANG